MSVVDLVHLAVCALFACVDFSILVLFGVPVLNAMWSGTIACLGFTSWGYSTYDAIGNRYLLFRVLRKTVRVDLATEAPTKRASLSVRRMIPWHVRACLTSAAVCVGYGVARAGISFGVRAGWFGGAWSRRPLKILFSANINMVEFFVWLGVLALLQVVYHSEEGRLRRTKASGSALDAYARWGDSVSAVRHELGTQPVRLEASRWWQRSFWWERVVDDLAKEIACWRRPDFMLTFPDVSMRWTSVELLAGSEADCICEFVAFAEACRHESGGLCAWPGGSPDGLCTFLAMGLEKTLPSAEGLLGEADVSACRSQMRRVLSSQTWSAWERLSELGRFFGASWSDGTEDIWTDASHQILSLADEIQDRDVARSRFREASCTLRMLAGVGGKGLDIIEGLTARCVFLAPQCDSVPGRNLAEVKDWVLCAKHISATHGGGLLLDLEEIRRAVEELEDPSLWGIDR